MSQTTLGSDDIVTELIVLALVAAAIIGIIMHTRAEWGALRHKLARRPGNVQALLRPSSVALRLSSPKWSAAFRDTLEHSCRDVEAEGNPAAIALFRAVQDQSDELSELTREIASRAMTDGDLQSALVRLEQGLLYLLVFPGRHDDRRTLRRFPSLADGWPEHAANVRTAASAGKAPMIALLYFLGLDAHDGKLLVAYDGDENRRFPAELGEAPVSTSTGPSLTYDFVLS
jgi:hypothetical protein